MKIKELEINSFRGVPKKLSISFPIKNNKPASLIILGDNGVGKSSIVDSFEFCLQGHISQTKSFNLLTSPSVKSYYSKKLPEIIVTLENNEVIRRRAIDDEEGLLSSMKEPHKLFSISPFVLRRHDILRFINSSDAERTLVFSNYLRQGKEAEWAEHPEDELKRLQNERLKIKKKRDLLIKSLANELKISIEDIPFGEKEFKLLVKEKIYKGLSKNEIEEKGIKVKLNQKAVKLAEDVWTEKLEHRRIKTQIQKFSIQAKFEFPKHLFNELEQFLAKVSEKLTDAFFEISTITFLEKIEIKYDNRNKLALSLKVILKNKQKCNPNQLLSEANLDLLALLFFLSFIQESAERGQSKFIILDDVLQSVDATIRVSIISYLLKNFSDWQYIITTHDRLWQRQLQELMNLNGHSFFNISIVGWSFEKGPEIRSIASNIQDTVKSALEEKSLINICSTSGLLLEELSDALSKSLSTSVQRKRDDRYTLADLLPGILKQLKKTSLKESVEGVEKWIHLRNLIGAHFNEWALALSLEEAKQFGESVIALLDQVKCKKCYGWISNNVGLNFYSCKCGTILIQKK